MQHLTQSEFSTAIAQGIVVVDFYATRCGPCKFIAPHLEELASKLTGQVTFYKVDVDAEMWLAQSQEITAMPTMKVFKDGQVIETIVGADLQTLVNTLQSIMTVQDPAPVVL